MSAYGEDGEAYLVVQEEQRFRVVRDNGRVVMVCNDADSARHYAVLLNEAYRVGYRSGYRAARRAAG